MKFRKFITLGLVLFSFLLSAFPVYAQDPAPTPCIANAPDGTPSPCIIVDPDELGFAIPTLSDILTFALRAIFVLGGLAALFFLLLGAFTWITSGGDKDKVAAAQAKIQAALVGVIMIAVVLAIVVTLEQVIFNRKICLGLSCPITIPSLLKAPGSAPADPVAPVLNTIIESPTATPIPPTPVPVTDASSTPTITPIPVPNTIIDPYSDQYGTYPKLPNSGR